MPAGDEPLIKTIDIEAPCEFVFDFLVRPGNMTRWIGVYAELDPKVGGIVRIDPNGRDVIRGTVLEILRPTRLVFTWGWERPDSTVPAGSTVVEITLTPVAAGTRLTLVHRRLPDGMRDRHDVGWSHYLGRLKIVAEGREPGPDPYADPTLRHG
jgi:uncharacterized protein YndB with AHSA1/START domain